MAKREGQTSRKFGRKWEGIWFQFWSRPPKMLNSARLLRGSLLPITSLRAVLRPGLLCTSWRAPDSNSFSLFFFFSSLHSDLETLFSFLLCGCFFISTWRPLCAIVRLNTLLPTFHHNRLYFVFYQPPVDASMVHKALLIVLLTTWWIGGMRLDCRWWTDKENWNNNTTENL
jgi:hypothetical protein